MEVFGFAGKGRVATATAIGLALSAGVARADVAPADVWADWQGYFTSSGYEVSGDESQSGDALTVSDITLSMEMPEDQSTVSVNMGEMTFTDNRDGTVAVSIPETMQMRVNLSSPDTGDVDVGLTYETGGFEMTASGNPDDLLYNYSAADIALLVDSVTIDGEAMELGTIELRMADVMGSTTMTTDALRSSKQKMSTGPVSYLIDVTDPEGSGGTMMLNGKAESMTLAANGTMPLEMDPNNLAASINDGLTGEGTITYSKGTTDFRFTDADETTEGTSSSDGGKATVAIGAEGLTYGISATEVKTKMTGSELPLPIELGYAEAAFNLTVPIAESEEAQDFALGLTLGDFTMSDMIWGIFDPSGQLPHDPATVELDLSGTAKLFFDLFDPEQMAAVEAGEIGVPGELNTLDINTLNVSAAGAQLTGEGGFTFDNTDLETFDGMPAPEGSVDLTLTGANGLMDTLIAMGLLPQEQAMGVRMMMGMFAVPGDGEDTLTSTIEVTGDGQVLANGQRLR